jgi:hypothetical protein
MIYPIEQTGVKYIICSTLNQTNPFFLGGNVNNVIYKQEQDLLQS